MTEEKILEQSVGQARHPESLREPLPGDQRLRGVLEEHRIARHERWNDRVRCSEKRVIPRGDHQDQADGFVRNSPPDPFVGFDDFVGDSVFSERQHPVDALDEGSLLPAVAHRPPHLPREFGHDFGIESLHRVNKAGNYAAALRKWYSRPIALRTPGAGDENVELNIRMQRAPGIFASIDRRDAD